MAGNPPPQLNVPHSMNTVSVKVIDSTARLRVPLSMFLKDRIPGHEFLDCPAYAFLVEHSSGQKVLFDLAVRKDTTGFAPVILESLTQAKMPGSSLTVEKDIATILRDEGSLDLRDINAIIWSHWHLDHSGDPSTFPSTTSLVVGPGFKDSLLPGYPANPQGAILETDYQGRDLQEINFDTHPRATKIGRFSAVDYFGDGSFYLLNAPGHTFGHIAGLARTTPSTFILMGADTCHHCGSFRPTEYLPLPEQISPSPLADPPFLPGTVCPGEVLVNIHPHQAHDKPFYKNLAAAPDRNVEEAETSIDKMAELDASEDIFVIIAHDSSLLSIIDFFPKKANDWKEKGWKQESRWKFLADFKDAVAASEK